jgi:hypothetical protein
MKPLMLQAYSGSDDIEDRISSIMKLQQSLADLLIRISLLLHFSLALLRVVAFLVATLSTLFALWGVQRSSRNARFLNHQMGTR